jgi:predicted dehydrogenase
MRCAVWASADQVQLLQRAFASKDLSCAVLGCDDPTARQSMAEALCATQADDLRQMLQHPDVDAIWLAAPRLLDASLRTLIANLKTPVATSAPCVEGFAPHLQGDCHAHFMPLFRAGPSFQAAQGCMEHLGAVRCMQVSATAGDHQTSLRALLLDATDLIVHLGGMPDEVFAVHSGTTVLTADPSAEMSGHLTASMRFANGAAASLTVSDGGGTWIRRATVLGEGGRVILTDEGVSWTDPAGVAQEAPPSESHATAGALTRWHLLRLGHTPPDAQPGPKAALLCEALRLSCLTGQVEETEHVAKMFGA